MKVVIINGTGKAGKDSFVNMCKLIDPKIQNYSTVDAVKDVARKMGWNDDKSEEGRLFLSGLKELWDNYNHGATNGTVKRATRYIELMKEMDLDSHVFIHCREPEKIDELKSLFDVPVITLLVENPNVPEITSNHSDRDVRNYDYDVTIMNDGTLDDLRNSARWFYYTWLVG